MSAIDKELLDAATEMVASAKGEATESVVHVPERVDVKAIRKAQGLTQKAFAARFGFSEAAVKDREQGPARAPGAHPPARDRARAGGRGKGAGGVSTAIPSLGSRGETEICL